MGAICPKPKKDDNWSEDSKNLLEEIARNLCEDDEQCKDDVKGDNEFEKMLNSIFEQKKKSDTKDPENPKKLRFN
jgi:hypothetical protein